MIRPTFLAFETAKKALNVSQTGLDTVGHNISNANTPGYTRQRVDQVSLSMGGTSAKYQTYGTPKVGLGADVRAVSQIRDPYLDNRYRTEATNNGELGVKYDGLADINNIFDEIMSNGLHSKMGDLINAIDIFAQQADSKELAMVVRNTANELVKILNKNAAQLEEARTQQMSDLTATVEENVNNILEKISVLNDKIKEASFHGDPANELNDERNMLIDKLSEYVDIKVVRTPQQVSRDLVIENVSIELRNSGDAAKGLPDIKLVEGGQYNKFKVSEEDSGPNAGNVKITVVDGVSGYELDLDGNYTNGVNGDITNKLFKGGIKGYIDILNGAGPGATGGVSTFRGIPYYQASLDEFARQLADVFNKVNNISAEEAANSGTPPLISETIDKNLFAPTTLSFNAYPSDQPEPKWIDAIIPGTRQFSGTNYEMTFDRDTDGNITATIDGKTYTGAAQANGTIDFVDIHDDPANPNNDKSVAFSIRTTSDTPVIPSGIKIDANITAKNISVSSSWVSNPLYLTTTKKNPVTEAKAELTLTGNSNPSWLSSVSLASPDDKVPNGSYVFKFDSTPDPNRKISVTIDGVEYEGIYAKNSTIKLTNKTTGKEGLTIVTNGRDVPATTKDTENTATIKNITGAAADNINKLKVAIKDSNHYTVSGFSGNFQEFLVNFQSEMALDKSLNESQLEFSTMIISGYADQRDSISAVSIDEEGINMMTYQNYYNAAARYMNVLDEALDKIINGMGLVGR